MGSRSKYLVEKARIIASQRDIKPGPVRKIFNEESSVPKAAAGSSKQPTSTPKDPVQFKSLIQYNTTNSTDLIFHLERQNLPFVLFEPLPKRKSEDSQPHMSKKKRQMLPARLPSSDVELRRQELAISFNSEIIPNHTAEKINVGDAHVTMTSCANNERFTLPQFFLGSNSSDVEKSLNPDDPVALEDVEPASADQTLDHVGVVEVEKAREELQGSRVLGETTPSTSTERSRVDAPRKLCRKRVSCPSRRKINVAKEALNRGKEHVSAHGKLRPAKELKPGCSEGCNRCERHLTEEERESVRSSFYELGDHQRQSDYILRHIKSTTPQKKYAAPGSKGCANIRHYSLTVNGKDIPVCKKTFQATLRVSDSWIQRALSGGRGEPGFAPADCRGRHNNRPRTATDDLKKNIQEHIDLVPRVESHYTRTRCKREFVENGLSVEALYRRYVDWAKDKNHTKIASARQYRKVFVEEYNIGFFVPKKDQCPTCMKFKHATTLEKIKLAAAQAEHTENRNVSRKLKEEDKKAAENKKDRCVACFDLQKVLTVPRSENGTFFYLNKVSLYNFTLFDLNRCVGTCYLWDETQARRGANEIASNVFHYIKTLSNNGISDFIFYSDNPTSQNKNRMVFAMYLLACTQLKVKIVHRFLESEHTQMEVDSMHARIESEAARKEIYDVQSWISLISNAKKSGQSYLIEKIGESVKILNFKPLVQMQNWDHDTAKNSITWTKVREVSVDPAVPNTVILRYDLKSSETITLDVTKRKGPSVNLQTFVPSPAYSDRIPLPVRKVKDLKSAMRSGAIPTQYHPYFERLFTIGERHDNEDNCTDSCCFLCEDFENTAA